MVVLVSSFLTALIVAGGSPWPDLTENMKKAGGGEGDAAVVVGVEDYTYLPDVVGAKRNTLAWYRYFTKVRGVPATRVYLLEDADATPGKISRALADASQKVRQDGTLWFVFVGHGAPSRDGSDGVLVGKDAHADVDDFYPDTLSRSEVLRIMGEAAGGASVAVLDACFSGQNTAGGQLIRGAQFAVPAALGEVADVTVLSAGRAEDLAGPLPGARRPAFSYLVLGALVGWGDADEDRQVTASEAVTYARDVLRVLEPGRRQEPQLAGTDRSLARRVKSSASRPDLGALREQLRGGGTLTTPPAIVSGGPTIESGTATAAVADVAILAEPKKLVRLEVTPPRGKTIVSGAPYKNRAGEPGTWTVKAKAAGYEAYEATFHAPVDDVTVHRIQLKELGSLEITGTPKGATVKVTGPGRFSHTGALTWKASGLKSGTYRVKVSRKGYEEQEKTVEVKPGRRTRLPVELQKIIKAFTGGGGSGKKGVAGIEWVYSKPAGISFARSETTVAQYRACVEAGKCESKHHRDKSKHKNCNWGHGDRDDHPMNCVSWYGADQFCEWAGGRLPTEQEWEAEAGAGGTRTYPWGSEEPSCSRCVMADGGGGCGEKRTWPVCSKRTGDSVSGLCDMAGNVWEWTSSWYDSDKRKRVLRGGSWVDVGIQYFRASDRHGFTPGHGCASSGFRCVVSSQ